MEIYSPAMGMISCPSDAEIYVSELQAIWRSMNGPALRNDIFYWKKDYDDYNGTGAIPSQYKILDTADPKTNPIFVFFADGIGTPLRSNPSNGGWGDWRNWLDSNGYKHIALLGDHDFHDSISVPAHKIPMTGTLYELFSAIRSGDGTDLRIYDFRFLKRASSQDDSNASSDSAFSIHRFAMG